MRETKWLMAHEIVCKSADKDLVTFSQIISSYATKKRGGNKEEKHAQNVHVRKLTLLAGALPFSAKLSPPLKPTN